MLTGLAVHGQAHEAATLFHDMWRSGLKPDGITFTAVLTACRSMGLVTEAWEYFDNMEAKYGVAPTAEHHACMVDLLAWRRYLDEAMAFIQRSPADPGASSWGALPLLTGCAIYGNLDLAESAARHLFKLEPHNSANYLAMMSLYEQHQMFDEAESLKYAMEARGVDARPGWSWTQVGRSVHVFEVDGGSPPYPETPEIYGEMSRLVSQIRMVGYVPDTGCVAYDVPEEEKERLLLCHTENLGSSNSLVLSSGG
ncbi:hypothetical protein CFC21_040109 [Triticum aestivum]|uniref:Uncharacterized protein n=2 Tax=Triticum aestivum TaxID=4565 RepID=A0A3B6FGY0_WHEAT|nr:hypothetical protein CFC21_040109 [Triticum aestivum]